MEDLLAQVLTIGGPVALLAILSIFINYKLTLRWMDSYEKSIQAVTTALGRVQGSLSEVNESLRRRNGKEH